MTLSRPGVLSEFKLFVKDSISDSLGGSKDSDCAGDTFTVVLCASSSCVLFTAVRILFARVLPTFEKYSLQWYKESITKFSILVSSTGFCIIFLRYVVFLLSSKVF